ncbi:MAG TPA: hypothetical protein VFN75_10790 [Pseudonocardiaceae bacterium]|nr:hypothetical protein [Pseudonocardiaceae bacterium]
MTAAQHVPPSPACRAPVSGVSGAGARRVTVLFVAKSPLALPELVAA